MMAEQENPNQLMIIRRTLCPSPHENPTEVIYSGKWLDEEEVSKKVVIGPKEARNYLYTISELEIKKENKDNNPMLDIRETSVTYEDILRGYNCIDFMNRTVSTSQIHLDNSTRKGLLELLDRRK